MGQTVKTQLDILHQGLTMTGRTLNRYAFVLVGRIAGPTAGPPDLTMPIC